MASSPSSGKGRNEFITDYNNVLQPLSIDLEVGECYGTSANDLIEITGISVTVSTIAYVKLTSDGSNPSTTTTTTSPSSVTGHDFFKLLEPGLTIDRTFKIVKTGTTSIYTLTSDVTTDTKVGDAVNAAKAAAQKAAADKVKMTASPPPKSIPPAAASNPATPATAAAAADAGPDIERIEDKLYPKMEAERKANIAYSNGVNIPVTLTISDGRKFKFQILECKPEENSNGSYRYNVWSSERTFYRELSKCFDDIKAKNADGHYYHQDPVGRSRWFQITQADFDRLISAKTGIRGWEISQVSGSAGTVDKIRIKLTDGTWAVDAISKPMLGLGGFKESDQKREEGGNKSNTDGNTKTVVHTGTYKVSPSDATSADDAKMTTMFDFYIEKDYMPMDGSWRCVTCYLVTIRPKMPTQFPVHLKNFFSANLKPSDKIDADKISAALSKSGKKVELRRRWWLTNTGGLQFILPAFEYRTWVETHATAPQTEWWKWELLAEATAGPPVPPPKVFIPGKWQNKVVMSKLTGIIGDNTVAAAAAKTNKEGRNVDVHGTCTFKRSSETDSCTFIMHAPTESNPSSFAVVVVKLKTPKILQPKPAIMQLEDLLLLNISGNKDSKFVGSIKMKLDRVATKAPNAPNDVEDGAIMTGGANISILSITGYIKLYVSMNSADGSKDAVYFPTINDRAATAAANAAATATAAIPHNPQVNSNEYVMELNGVNFRIIKSEPNDAAPASKKFWIIDAICEDVTKLTNVVGVLKHQDPVYINVIHRIIKTSAADYIMNSINRMRPSISLFTDAHQYSEPTRNVCLGGVIFMAFSITANDYKEMRDYLLAKKEPRLNWTLKDAKTIITNSTWARDAAAESEEYNVSAGIGGGPGAADKIGKPGGMAFDLEGNLLVADSVNHCIHIFNRKTGESLGKIGSGPPNSNPNCDKLPKPACCFDSPQDVKFNPNDGVDGQLVVCDTGNNRIVIIDYATGEEVRNIDLVTPAGLKSSNPSSISILKIVKNSNDIETVLIVYVNDVDAAGKDNFGRIRFFNMLSGVYMGELNDPGIQDKLSLGIYSPDKFVGSIAIDSDNNLIIADPANNRIVTCAMIIKKEILTVVKLNKLRIQSGDKFNGVFISGSRIFMTMNNDLAPSKNALIAGSYTIENSNSDTKTITIEDAPEYGKDGIVQKVPDKTITSVTAYTDGAIFVSDTTDNTIRVYTDKKAELAKSLKPLDRTADYSDAGKAAYDVKIVEADEKLEKINKAMADEAAKDKNQVKLTALKAEKDQLEKELKAAKSGKAFHESREKGFAAKKRASDAKIDADEAQRNVTWNWKWKIFLTDIGKTNKAAAIATAEDRKEHAEQAKIDAKTAVDDAGRAHHNARQDAYDAENGESQKSLNLQNELISGKHTDPALTPAKKQ